MLDPKIEEMFNRILLNKHIELEGDIIRQPERSKREDHVLIYKNEKGHKTPIRDLFNPDYGCGALNTMET